MFRFLTIITNYFSPPNARLYIKESSVNKYDIKEILSELKEQFEAIFWLLDNPSEGLSPRENLKLISSQYSELKAHVNERSNKLQKSKTLNDVQTNFLLPAFRDVALHCTARKGSMNKIELGSSLYDGSDYCSYYIGQIDV